MAYDKETRLKLKEKADVLGDKRFTYAILRAFDFICSIEQPDGCLSTSVALLVVLRSIGYAPKLCYGLCKTSEGYEFYHSWIELNKKVIDLAVYGNSHYSPFWLDGPLDPVIMEPYENTSVRYGDQVFDEDWEECAIHYAITNNTLLSYIENAPWDGMWKLIFKLMNETYNSKRVRKMAEKIPDEPLMRNVETS